MDVLKTIAARFSARPYTTDEVSDEVLHTVLEAGWRPPPTTGSRFGSS